MRIRCRAASSLFHFPLVIHLSSCFLPLMTTWGLGTNFSCNDLVLGQKVHSSTWNCMGSSLQSPGGSARDQNPTSNTVLNMFHEPSLGIESEMRPGACLSLLFFLNNLVISSGAGRACRNIWANGVSVRNALKLNGFPWQGKSLPFCSLSSDLFSS